MLPSLEQIWELCLRTSSMLLLEGHHYVEFTMIVINLEWGENNIIHSCGLIICIIMCDVGLDVTLLELVKTLHLVISRYQFIVIIPTMKLLS